MNYGEVKKQFQAMLNRRDITPSMVENFCKQSIQRAQRLLRVPASEDTVLETVEDTFDGLDIPGDYLKLVSLSVNDNELSRVNLNTANFWALQGCPKFYARDNGKFIIGPRPYAGDTIKLVYSRDFSSLVADEDSNFLTEIAPDVIVAGALSAACDFYTDPRKASFEDTFVKSIVDLNNQAFEDELTNAVIAPAHNLDFAW